MRLAITCHQPVMVTKAILDIFSANAVTLKNLDTQSTTSEPNTVSRLYLQTAEVGFDTLSQIMRAIRNIADVIDVKTCPFMPNEQERMNLHAIVDALPDPVIFIHLNGQLNTANLSALTLLKITQAAMNTVSIFDYLPSLKTAPWFQTLSTKDNRIKAKAGDEALLRYRKKIIIEGLNYLMDMVPVSMKTDTGESIYTHAVIMLKPILVSETKLTAMPDRNPLGFEHFVGHSALHQRLMAQAKKLAMLDQPLLIEGETGTGKEMLARACHDRSQRAQQPFLVLSCASIPDDVAETELFGDASGGMHAPVGQKGIFEQAHQGTVFLDEIGEMSPHLQIKLLRFLQDGSFRRVGEEQEIHVDVRVIASTKQTLSQLTQEGSFREDLYYRLNVLNLRIPALRERSADILPLFDLFVTKYAQHLGVNVPNYDETLTEQLLLYPWPGNIRQLENSVLRAMTQLEGDRLTFEHFQLPRLQPNPSAFEPSQTLLNLDGSWDEMKEKYEADILRRLYPSFPSSRKLAKRLGVSHTSIANKLRDYGIPNG